MSDACKRRPLWMVQAHEQSCNPEIDKYLTRTSAPISILSVGQSTKISGGVRQRHIYIINCTNSQFDFLLAKWAWQVRAMSGRRGQRTCQRAWQVRAMRGAGTRV